MRPKWQSSSTVATSEESSLVSDQKTDKLERRRPMTRYMCEPTWEGRGMENGDTQDGSDEERDETKKEKRKKKKEKKYLNVPSIVPSNSITPITYDKMDSLKNKVVASEMKRHCKEHCITIKKNKKFVVLCIYFSKG
jgi:hypothetical protein